MKIRSGQCSDSPLVANTPILIASRGGAYLDLLQIYISCNYCTRFTIVTYQYHGYRTLYVISALIKQWFMKILNENFGLFYYLRVVLLIEQLFCTFITVEAAVVEVEI